MAIVHGYLQQLDLKLEHRNWTDELAQQLRDLMAQSGLIEPQIAQWTALSLRQVLELTEGLRPGESSCFYSDGIKRHAGLRIIRKLEDLN